MMKAQDAAALAERIDAQLVILFYCGVSPGCVPPEEPEKLLKRQNRPYFSPAYEENFVL